MALIKCPECKKDISDTIETCIHCGFKLKPHTILSNVQTNKFSNNQKNKSTSSDDSSGCGCGCFIIIITIIIALFFGVKYFNRVRKEKASEAAQSKIIFETQEIERKKLANEALSKLEKYNDDVTGVMWYSSTKFEHSNKSNAISLKIGIKDDRAKLYIKMSYSGEKAQGFNNAYLSYNGNTIEIPFTPREYSVDAGYSTLMEAFYFYMWIDTIFPDKDFSFLINFVNSENAKMRLSGQYSNTRNLS